MTQTLDPAQTGIDVAADVDDRQVRSHRQQLGHSPRRTGSDAGPLRQLTEGETVTSHQGVARILANRDGTNRQSEWASGRQVLEGVDGDVG